MHNMNSVRMLDFHQFGDDRGHLVVAEGNKDIPFEIKRVFYIYGSDKKVVLKPPSPVCALALAMLIPWTRSG